MGKYEDTLKDIETTLGIVPGSMKALAEDVLIQEWPLMKIYVVGESKIPGKYTHAHILFPHIINIE